MNRIEQSFFIQIRPDNGSLLDQMNATETEVLLKCNIVASLCPALMAMATAAVQTPSGNQNIDEGKVNKYSLHVE